MNGLILLYLLCIAPKLLWDRLTRGKKHPALLQRFGFQIPQTKKPVIWIHAVSVGEVKAAQPLFRELKKKNPAAFFLITTTSATGQAEAIRSLSQADAFAYLPVDLSWVVNRWVKQLNPIQFILLESDFWPNLLRALKKQGTKIFLVSGKMSERSAKRFRKFSFFAKKLFSRFDQICVQNQEHYDRFLSLVPDPSRLHITGNLKLDIEPQAIHRTLTVPQPAITLSCTHAPEEEWLLDALYPGPWFLILVPRHPERFEEVAQLLKRKQIPFSRWSQQTITGSVLLVDAMGQLPLCYASSRLAIVAGSYASHIGGHNILEPSLYGTPVFFGPHTHGQVELAARALHSGAGRRVELSELREAISAFFNDSKLEEKMKRAACEMIHANRGATNQTLKVLFT